MEGELKMKLKVNMIKLLSVFLALFLIAGTIVHANDTPTIDNTGSTGTTVGGEPQIRTHPISRENVPPKVGDTNHVPNRNGSSLDITNKGNDNVRVDALIPITPGVGENGQPITPSINDVKFGTEVTAENTQIYNTNLLNFVQNAQQALMKCVEKSLVNINGQWYIKAGFEGNMKDAAKISKTLEMAQYLKDNLNPGADLKTIVEQALEAAGLTSEHPEYQQNYEFLMAAAENPAELERILEKFGNLDILVIMAEYIPPKQVVHNNPTPKDGGASAKWNALPQPGSVTCDRGSGTGFRSKCIVGTDEQFMSSYTTTTPDDSDPPTRANTPFCDDQLPGYLQFSEIMNPFGNRVYDNKTLLNNGTSKYLQYKYQDKFNENPWKSSWRGEKRNWNPFKDGNKLSGIPYKVAWTEKFDGWYDQEYTINPEAKKSFPIRDKAEANNNRIAQKYGQSGNNFKVFLNAPNKPMEVTALNLDTNTWDKAKTGNAFGSEQYELKIVPRYNILQWDRYRLFDWHHTVMPSWEFRCVETKECKEWAERCVRYGRRECVYWNEKTHRCMGWDYPCLQYEEYCAAYITEAKKFDLGGVNVKYPKGMTEKGPTPAGSIPPVYKQRRKYQYRTGALVEYHAMTRPYGKTTMIPVPNSKDTSKMKSGYGFGYTSGVQMITDYDRAPSTYKFNPVIIRPNKATNLNIRTNNYKSSYGLFDSNVRYDKAKNAPERSSSIDKTFIEETLRGGLTKTTFKPSAISNVEKVDGKAKDFTDVEAMPVKSSMVRKTAVKWGEMTSTFKISSNPAKYYHAYWKTKGEPNLIPAYKPGPLHYVYLDYPSGSDYTVASLDTINLNGKGFFATGMNTGSIKIVGNMWEDSFSRPNFKK